MLPTPNILIPADSSDWPGLKHMESNCWICLWETEMDIYVPYHDIDPKIVKPCQRLSACINPEHVKFSVK